MSIRLGSIVNHALKCVAVSVFVFTNVVPSGNILGSAQNNPEADFSFTDTLPEEEQRTTEDSSSENTSGQNVAENNPDPATPTSYPSGSSCENPVSWIEDKPERTEYSKTYFVPLNEEALEQDPTENPEMFSYQSCIFATQQSYSPGEESELIDIDNTIIPLENPVTTQVNLDPLRSGKTKQGRGQNKTGTTIEYAYTNQANDFNVLFPTDPNDGYSFTNRDGSVVEIVEVVIGEQNLQTSPDQIVLEDNLIRYTEVLPEVDLEYIVYPESVAKYVVLKSEKALENNLSSIRLTYSAQTRQLNKRNEAVTKRTARKEEIRQKKIEQAASKLERELRKKSPEEQANIRQEFDLQTEIDSLEDQERELRPNSGQNKNKSEEEKAILAQSREEVDSQIDAYKRLLRAIKADELTSTEVELEIKRIQNLTSAEDKLVIGSEDVNLTTPIVYDASNQIQTETYSVSDNGKEVTILPDPEYLAAEERKFPIRIDPQTTQGSVTKDTWASSYYPTSNRNNSGNRHHLATGGNPSINVGYGSESMGTTQSFISFDLPGEVGANQVINAQLRVKQYSSNGGSFRANIHNACDFDENAVTWYNRPCIAGAYGHIDFDGYNCASNQCTDGSGGDRWSSNIASLLNGNLGGGSYLIRLAILDSNENAARGVAYCAKDANNPGHPCDNGGKGPYLHIEYNRPATTPNPVRPDFEDYIGGCDLSLNTGNCNKDTQVQYRIENLSDGEGGCNVRAQVVERSQFEGFYDGDSFDGCAPDHTAWHEQGDFEWTAKSVDNYGAQSSTSDKRLKLTVDNSAPLLQSESPLPEYSAGQINTVVPEYADNIQEKYVLEYAGAKYFEQNAYLKNRDQYWGVAQSLSTGAPVVLQPTIGAENTEWRLKGDNTLRPVNNQNFCLGIDRTDAGVRTIGSRVSLQDCTSSRGKRWIHTGYNQYKSYLSDEVNPDRSLCLSAQENELSVDECDRQDANQEIILENNNTLRKAFDIGASGNDTFSDAHLWDLSTTNINQTFTLEHTGIPDEFRVMTKEQKCLNTGNWVHNTNAWKCSGNDYQTWRYDRETMEMKVKAGGFTHCLNVPNANTGNGANIQADVCNQSWSQKWRFVKVEETPAQYSDLIMRGNGMAIDGTNAQANANVHMYPRHNGGNQQWTYLPTTQQFKLFAGNNLCLNKNSNNLNLATCTSTPDQRFEIIDGGRIKHISSELCIDAVNYNPEANVYLYPCHSGANQSFTWAGNLDGLLQGQQLSYNVQISPEPNFEPEQRIDLGWQRSPYIQYPNDIVSNFSGTAILQHRPNGKVMEHGCLSNDCRPYVRSENGTPPQTMIITDEERIDFINVTKFRIRPETYSELCLELIGNSDPTFELCSKGNTAQQWQRHDLYLSNQGGQFEGIRSSAQPNRCLDIPYSNAYNGATVRMGNCSSHPAQDFELVGKDVLNTEPIILQNGEEYFVRVRAKDRTFGAANTSAWSTYRTTIDAQPPRLIETNFNNRIIQPETNTQNIEIEAVLEEENLDRIEAEVYGTTNEYNDVTVTTKAQEIISQGNVQLDQIRFKDKLIQTKVNSDKSFQMRHRSQTSTQVGDWSAWTTQDGLVRGNITTINFNDRLHQITSLENQSGRFAHRYSDDGVNWSNWQLLSGGAVNYVNAEVFDGYLYIVLNANGSNAFNIRRSSDGVNWSGWLYRSGGTGWRIPQLLTYKDRLYLYTKGTDSQGYYQSSSDGVNWSEWQNIPDSHYADVSLYTYKGILYQSRVDANFQLHVRFSTDGNSWSPWESTGERMRTQAPQQDTGFFVHEDQLYQHIHNSLGELRRRTTTNGTDWSAWETLSTYDTNVAEANATTTTLNNVHTFSSCVQDGNSVPCTAASSQIDEEGRRRLTLSWDGRGRDGEPLPDGIYEVRLRAYDKAGQVSELPVGDNFITLDSSAQGIKVSYPKDNGYVRNSAGVLKGGLYTLTNGNNNLESLQVSRNGSSQIDITPTEAPYTFTLEAGDFNDTVLYEPGVNTFEFTATDTIGNTETVTHRVVLETDTPTIVELDSDAHYGMPSFGLGFTVDDATSGLYTGNNPTGYDISLVQEQNGSNWQEIPLFSNGQPISNVEVRLTSDLTCGETTEGTTCQWSMLNFQTAGTYHFLVRVRDRAGNEVCNHDFSQLNESLTCDNYADVEQSFAVRTDLFHQLHTPANQTTFAGEVLADGVMEKGSTLTLTNTALGRELRHQIEQTEAILPAEYDSNTDTLIAQTGENSPSRGLTHDGTRLGIECDGQTRDHDTNPNTPAEEVCRWEVYVNLTGDAAGEALTNEFIVTGDKEGTTRIETFAVNYDATAINIASTSALDSFSPNDDGFLDTIEFENSATTAIYITPQTEANNSANHATEFTTASQINPSEVAGEYTLYLDVENLNATLEDVDLALNVYDTQNALVRTLNTDQLTILPDETGYFAYTLANLDDGEHRLELILTDPTGTTLYNEGTILEFTVENTQNANTLETVQADYRAVVRDTGGNIVWQSPIPSTLNTAFGEELRDIPTRLEYDGRVNTESTVENNHGLSLDDTLPDGTYTYEFSIKQSPEGVTYTTAPLSFGVVTSIPTGGTPVIQTPRDGFVTTQGLVQVRGQASPSTTQNPYTVEICLRDTPDNCLYRSASRVSESGNFGTLISLPEITKTTTLQLTARTRDEAGNATEYSPPRTVIIDPGPVELNITTTADHTGRSSLQDIEDFYAGDLPLEELKVVTFALEVDQYTEAVDLDIVGNITPDTASTDRQRLATVTAQSEESLTLNPQENPQVKADRRDELTLGDGYLSGKELGDGARCEDLNTNGKCTWIYRYVLGERAELNAGVYAVEATAYKGESVVRTSTSFEINGITPYAPRILSADKLAYKPNCTEGATPDGYEDCQELQRAIQLYDYLEDEEVIYTNTRELTLRGASDPLSQVTLRLDNTDVTVTAQASEAGVFNLPILTLPDTAGRYPLTLEAANGGITTASSYDLAVNYDTTAPVVTSVQTDTVSEYTPFATNPWIQSGDPVRVTFATDEPTHRGAIFNEQGFVCGTVKTNFALATIDENCIENGEIDLEQEEGLQQVQDPRTGEVIDCSQYTARELYTLAQSVPYICHQVYLTRGEHTGILTVSSPSGVFYPTLFAEDLAGNKTFYSNSTQQLDNTRNHLRRLNPASSYLHETDSVAEHTNNTVIEVDNLRSQLISGSTSGLSTLEQAVLNGDPSTDPLPAGYPYAQFERGKSLDMTLFVDQERTRKPEVILEGWGDLRDGVCAEESDIDLPEVDRQLADDYLQEMQDSNVPRNCPQVTVNSVNNDRQPVYVVKGNTFEVQSEVEQNQRVIMAYQLKAGEQEVGNTVYKALSGVEESGSCTSGTNNEVRTSDNQLVQRFTDTCTVTYSFEFPEGSGQAVGADGNAPSDNYVFRLYAVDLAGNLSVEVEDNSTGFQYNASTGETTALNNDTSFVQSTATESLQIYHDTREPVTPSLNLSSEDINSPITGSQEIGSTGDVFNRAITKSLEVVGSHSGEQQSDMEYSWLRVRDAEGNAVSETTQERLLVNGYDVENNQKDGAGGNGETRLPLGTQGDQRDGCVRVSNSPTFNRAVGTCADGVYGVSVESTDTAGNTSSTTTKIVERDTVRPVTPTLNVSKVDGVTNGVSDPFKQTLGMEISSAEQGASAYITVTENTYNQRTRVVQVPASGQINLNDAWGDLLHCGGFTYSVAVRVVDRAGNASDLVTGTVTTEACPVCQSLGSGAFASPVRVPYYLAGGYPVYGERAGDADFTHKAHAGQDFNIASGLVNIYAAAPGTVEFVRDDLPNVRDNTKGLGNYVVINHGVQSDGNRLVTIYAHLRPNVPVQTGQSVDENTILGLMGTSGYSTIQHLHFQVEQENAPDPYGLSGFGQYYTPVPPANFLSSIQTNVDNAVLSEYYCPPTSGGGYQRRRRGRRGLRPARDAR